MDVAALSTFERLWDKHGATGVALFVVCTVLIGFVFRVLPSITESHGKRLDSLVAAFKEFVGGFNARMDRHEAEDGLRYQILTGKLDGMGEQLKDIGEKLPEKKAEPS